MVVVDDARVAEWPGCRVPIKQREGYGRGIEQQPELQQFQQQQWERRNEGMIENVVVCSREVIVHDDEDYRRTLGCLLWRLDMDLIVMLEEEYELVRKKSVTKY